MNIGEVRHINDKLCLVTSGQYYGTHGVSNFWTWQQINDDGSLGKKGKGYNNGSLKLGKPLKHKMFIKEITE